MNSDKEMFLKLREWCQSGSVGCLCPSTRSPTSQVLNRMWEELHYYTAGSLDILLSELEGHAVYNATKGASLHRLKPLISKIFGGVELKEPKFITEARVKEGKKVIARVKASRLEEEDQSNEDTHMTDIIEPTNPKKKAMKKDAEINTKKKTVKKAAEINTKTVKKANPIATKSLKSKEEGRGRPGAFEEDQKITVLVKENPKREGSNGHKTFSLYKKHNTVGSFLKAGGTRADLRWDTAKEFIKIK